MGAFSNYMEGKIVDSFLRNTAYTPASVVYLALFTADPGEDVGGTECSYTNYARQAITFGAIAAGQTKNANLITFPANGSVGSVTVGWIVVYDALTLGTGNRLLYAPLTTSKLLATGDVLAFAIDACVFTLD